MDWTWFLFGFNGRINRARYWLSALILIGWAFFIAWMMYLALLLVARGYLRGETLRISFGLEEVFVLVGRALHRSFSPVDAMSLAGNLVVMTIGIWIFLATSIKRLHDRDRSGWWIVAFVVAPSLASYLGDWLGDSMLAVALGFVFIILCVWGFVEMALLPGTPWPNRFGSNPLGKQRAGSRSEHASLRGMPGWDQRHEIEFAPHKGSPPPL